MNPLKYMKLKHSLRWSLFILNVVVITFFGILIFFLAFGIPGQVSLYAKYAKTTAVTSSKNTTITGKQISFGIPIRLKIPKLKIDAPIKSLGLAADGSMAVTKGPYDVAWYNQWPRPGEKGSAVIAGHYGRWKNGAISVFNKLNTLVKGDKVSIEDDKGAIIYFIVRESKIYKLDADASNVFTSNDGKSHLNLVTCIQDKVTRKYPNRLVVFTDKEILTGSK